MPTSGLRLLERLAEDTWHRLRDAYQLGISIGEETITDLNLLEIRRAQLPEVWAVKVGRAQEARLGADWDWWIGNDVCGWTRYVVQAKKLDVGTGIYKSLRYKVPDGRFPEWQMERLIDFATVTGATPLYCFYNGGVALPPGAVCPRSPQEQYGCTVASIEAIKIVHAAGVRKSFQVVHNRNDAFPWRCLLDHHCDWLRNGKAPPVPWARHKVRRFPRLPPEIRGLREMGELQELPREYYPEELTVPRRIAVFRAPTPEEMDLDWQRIREPMRN